MPVKANQRRLVQVTEAWHLSDAVKVVQRLRARQPGHVLVLCDIDNTVLRMATPAQIGSDQWFRWQVALIEARTPMGMRVARDLRHLQSLASYMYAHGPADPCENGNTTASLLQLVRLAPMMFLTARAEAMRGVTMDQLDRVLQGFPASKLPLLMCGGRPKSFIAADHVRNYETIVFIDDSKHHIDEMVRAASDGPLRGKHLEAVWYRHEDANVHLFEAMDKATAATSYAEFVKQHPDMAGL